MNLKKKSQISQTVINFPVYSAKRGFLSRLINTPNTVHSIRLPLKEKKPKYQAGSFISGRTFSRKWGRPDYAKT